MSRNTRRAARLAALLALALLAPGAAPAQVPGEIDFQGLLLDSGGAPVNGVVDLDFELFDAPSGGSSLWTESHLDVSVLDGVYDVTLGSSTPLTPALLAGGALHLEITVEGETLSPRERIVAVPFALRAAEAENVGGVGSVFVEQIFSHGNHDGSGPGNADPREGLVDVDGDGLANFIDPDNDGDGLSDSVEISQGSDINLVTPSISGFVPDGSPSHLTSTVVVQGQGFQAGLSVVFGGETPAPMNLTPTSFEVEVGPQPIGDVAVVVTNPNGESDQDSFTFRGRLVFVTAASFAPDFGSAAAADAVCQAAADAESLGGSWVAWLSDSGGGPVARFSADPGAGWERIDGVVVADDLADLTDGTLDAPIQVTQTGSTVGGGSSVWSATATDGTASGGPTCSDWTLSLSGFSGGAANPAETDSRWTDFGQLSCGSSGRLYCFQQ